jgi:UDP-glucose 4-epimerase
MQRTRVLVTGGAGFIGSHLAERLVEEQHDVTVLDNLSTGSLDHLDQLTSRSNFRFIHGDIRDVETVNDVTRDVDVVFHEAALASVALSVDDPVLVNDVNVNGTLHLLEACRSSGVRRCVFASSAAVYGGGTPSPHETTTPRPTSPYAVTKLTAERYLDVYRELYGLETVCLRYFNVYGSRQSSNQYSGVIAIFIDRLENRRRPIIFGDGSQTRDFVHVEDVVTANLLALGVAAATGETFNVGTGRGVPITHLLALLQRITGTEDLRPVYRKPRSGDILHSRAEIGKARRILGFNPQKSLEDGLSEFVAWHTRASAS